MLELRVSVVGVALAGLVFLACVGDAPTSGGQGQLGGPCYPGDTCNAGLRCTSLDGIKSCELPPGDDASTTDAGSTSDSGPPVCMFAPTPYPCGGQEPPYACYGQARSCTATGCNDLIWNCNSPNQCSGTPCCVPPDALLVPGASCGLGTLQLGAAGDAGLTSGSACGAGTTCKAGETQLCQANAQCPAGKICSPVKITGGPASLNGTILGACVPE
jgi:hypothetical protein